VGGVKVATEQYAVTNEADALQREVPMPRNAQCTSS
jgi:hypothetical protein